MNISELLTLLPRLETTEDGLVDFGASDIVIVVLIAEAAETASRTLMRGIASIGTLMSHAGPEVDDGVVSSADVEALGLLIAELSAVADMFTDVASKCARIVPRLCFLAQPTS